MTSVKTHYVADSPSDHELLLEKIKVMLKNITSRWGKTRGHGRLNNPLFRETIRNELNEKMKDMLEEEPEVLWNKCKYIKLNPLKQHFISKEID